MSNTAKDWHRTPQARAIIARLREAEFRLATRICIPVDEVAYAPLTDRAARHIERLEAIRRCATNAELGYTYSSVSGGGMGLPVGEVAGPYDAAKSRAWIEHWEATPSVSDALYEAFQVRAAAEREAA